MKTEESITRTLREILAEKILILDGAMGTELQRRNLTACDFGGPDYEGCNEHLNLTRPDVVRDIHSGYYKAGADIVETNSFGSTPLVLAEYGLAGQAYEISRRAAEIAAEAARAQSTADKPRFVAGSMGPTTKTITVTGGVTFEQLIESYYTQARGLIDGGADLLILETAQDTRNLKAALIGIRRYMNESGASRPLMISGTIESMGTMLAGQGVEALYTSVEHAKPFTVGLNCATGPEFMTDHIRSMSDIAKTFISCYPNAGLPDEEGRYNETPESIAKKLERFADHGWINMVGGCCGTTAEHIGMIYQMSKGKKPRTPKSYRRTMVSGIDFLPVTDDVRPVLVGEVTNVLGSRKFKQLIAAGKYEEAAEMGRDQVRGGAQVLDVCLQDPDRNEMEDVKKFLDILIKKVKAPLMLDSTDHHVIEEGLKYCQGKAIINSINLEDGEERFQKVCPLIHQYGAAVVVGCIDEDKQQGMAVTAERKVAVAGRSYKLLTEKYGIAGEDILFDALVFPAGTGDDKYRGSGRATIDGVAAIKKAFPDAKTILGVSNVSFGLPPAGREVLNSVFLYLATKAGLDMAIVNSKRVMRYASIADKEKELCERVLFRGSDEDIAAFAAFYKEAKPKAAVDEIRSKPLEERLAYYIVAGTKEGLHADLDEALAKYPDPLDIINGPLMAGMAEVGRLFNNNELIVAEVLQSAESMKAAVGHLQPHMKKSAVGGKGKVILATVKGDVHDIGKNLVEIILSNNGYQVINLGIKCAPETLIAACREHKPDIVGLSGLLVKSAQQMVITAQDFHQAGIDVPLMVGGAALSRNFTLKKISPAYGRPAVYAREAMVGLDLANQIVEPAKRRALYERLGQEVRAAAAKDMTPAEAAPVAAALPARSPEIEPMVPVPTPPDLKRHAIDNYNLDEIFPYINPLMLYKKHLGIEPPLYKGGQGGVPDRPARTQEILDTLESLKSDCAAGLLRARAVFRFFPCRSEGNRIHIYESTGRSCIETFEFPRQKAHPFLCLADFVRAMDSPEPDYIALFVITCGEGVRQKAESLKNAGAYLKSHALQALAVESAEGFAELLHQKIRAMWNIADPAGTTMKDLLKAKYRGIRVSFGYPACPNLDDQKKLFALLNPADIGVALTDGCMMDPEASVSALVFHHPQAAYFSADK
ncbi:MAG: methionine synthase [Candidatus Lindowbacteria bacterium RIFCSPLOWO2_12_FULL_62_27]|nr:MAG: methionine synthase [Candidatus Lindowbacteria bacterium RIFCSPLOWO2_12_FULL_62_27]